MSKDKVKGKKATKRDAQEAKLQEQVKAIEGMHLLGEVITWSTKTEETHRHKDVVSALFDAGLDTAIARQLLPRFAFSRACKKLAADALIDVVRENETEIVFQFTKRLMKNEEWQYTKDTALHLNKTTGDISCPKKDLETKAQQLLDEAMEVRTTSDISKIVQRLFEKEGDLFPIREQGGVYFVPAKFTEFVLRIDGFISKLGGRLTRFPVPAGTQFGDKAVQDSIADAMMSMVNEHNSAVDGFTINTRKDTIEHAADRIKKTRLKIEAYANLLKEKAEELYEELEASNAKLMEKVKVLDVEREEAPEQGGLFGYSVTAVIRWMGKNNWKYDQVKKALTAKELRIADATIRAQLQAGRNGTRGEPAPLKKDQIKELQAAIAG